MASGITSAIYSVMIQQHTKIKALYWLYILIHDFKMKRQQFLKVVSANQNYR